MKLERDLDVVDKEECTGMKTDEVNGPSMVSASKTESEVSIVLRCFCDSY